MSIFKRRCTKNYILADEKDVFSEPLENYHGHLVSPPAYFF